MNYLETRENLSEVLGITLSEIRSLTENLEELDQTDQEYLTTLERIRDLQAIRERAFDDLEALITMKESGFKKVIKKLGEWFGGIDPNTIIKWVGIAFVVKLIASYEKSDEPIIFRSKAMQIFTKTI